MKQSKNKKLAKTVASKIGEIVSLAKKLYQATDQPVTIARNDWVMLRKQGRLTMRVPHDEGVAYLLEIPVKAEL